MEHNERITRRLTSPVQTSKKLEINVTSTNNGLDAIEGGLLHRNHHHHQFVVNIAVIKMQLALVNEKNHGTGKNTPCSYCGKTGDGSREKEKALALPMTLCVIFAKGNTT